MPERGRQNLPPHPAAARLPSLSPMEHFGKTASLPCRAASRLLPPAADSRKFKGRGAHAPRPFTLRPSRRYAPPRESVRPRFGGDSARCHRMCGGCRLIRTFFRVGFRGVGLHIVVADVHGSVRDPQRTRDERRRDGNYGDDNKCDLFLVHCCCLLLRICADGESRGGEKKILPLPPANQTFMSRN